MPRWIAFDQKTVSRLRERLPNQSVFEHAAPNVVRYAEGGAETLVAVLPAESTDKAAVAVFRKRAVERSHESASRPEAKGPVSLPQAVSAAPEPRVEKSSMRPGGVLGLRDEPIFAEETPKQKKTWWQKFWNEDDED